MQLLLVRTVSDIVEVPDDFKINGPTIKELAKYLKPGQSSAHLNELAERFLDETRNWPAIQDSQVEVTVFEIIPD